MELSVTFAGNRRIDVAVGNWVIHTDQSKQNGGDATAPEPFDLFLASIGACAGAYVAGFCKARNLDPSLIRLEESVTMDETGTLREVDIDVHVPPTFPEKYIGALKAVIEKCAVKKAIEAQPTLAVRTDVIHA